MHSIVCWYSRIQAYIYPDAILPLHRDTPRALGTLEQRMQCLSNMWKGTFEEFRWDVVTTSCKIVLQFLHSSHHLVQCRFISAYIDVIVSSSC